MAALLQVATGLYWDEDGSLFLSNPVEALGAAGLLVTQETMVAMYALHEAMAKEMYRKTDKQDRGIVLIEVDGVPSIIDLVNPSGVFTHG